MNETDISEKKCSNNQLNNTKSIKSKIKQNKKENKNAINKMQHNNDIISGKISSDIENVEWNVGTTTAQLPNVRYVLFYVHFSSFHNQVLFSSI